MIIVQVPFRPLEEQSVPAEGKERLRDTTGESELGGSACLVEAVKAARGNVRIPSLEGSSPGG